MPEKLDLKGKQFGEWAVGEYLGSSFWECTCSCGTVKPVLAKTLNGGKSKSCGHTTNKFIDMTGQKINEWTVIKYLGDSSWFCECSCGKTSTVGAFDLRNNNSKNCGHTRISGIAERNAQGRVKLEGTQQNEWEVLRYIGDKHYECRCSCGKMKRVAASDLVSGVSKACGHNNGKQSLKDLTGMTFGELKVLEYIGNKQWKCDCSCGKSTTVQAGHLKRGYIRSCGCKQYNRIEKNELIDIIEGYITKYGEKPFVSDLSKLIDRHEGNINRYINNYDLRHYINSEYGSRIERDVLNTFNTNSRRILHDRQILSGKELDVSYPDNKLALEINGDYWHSTLFKDKKYHQQKTIECAKQGIQLIHIFEYEWKNTEKRAKLISLINKKLNNQTTTAYGRNTDIKLVDTETTRKFITKYHLQNYANSDINVGCYLDDKLIGIMTFGKTRFNPNYQYELIRLAWDDKIVVVGGTEKIFKYFLTNYKPESILTYCDISKFTGNIYTKLGFKATKDCITEPNYVWVNSLDNIVLKR